MHVSRRYYVRKGSQVFIDTALIFSASPIQGICGEFRSIRGGGHYPGGFKWRSLIWCWEHSGLFVRNATLVSDPLNNETLRGDTFWDRHLLPHFHGVFAVSTSVRWRGLESCCLTKEAVLQIVFRWRTWSPKLAGRITPNATRSTCRGLHFDPTYFSRNQRTHIARKGHLKSIGNQFA